MVWSKRLSSNFNFHIDDVGSIQKTHKQSSEIIIIFYDDLQHFYYMHNNFISISIQMISHLQPSCCV